MQPSQPTGLPDPPAAPAPDWHALPADEVAARLDSPHGGLSEAEARRRLDRHGPNRLSPPASRPAWKRLAAQFNDVLIRVLLASAAVTGLLGHLSDTLVILGVVLINAAIGAIQEGRAERAIEALRDLLAPQATVLRGGQPHILAAELLVPGDRVLLAAGDRVPADLRLLSGKGLAAQEGALTGESVPVDKHASPVAAAAALGDRSGMLHSGTLVVRGQGVGVTVATGDRTEIGRIGASLAGVSPLTTPLVARMAALSRVAVWVILALAAATAAVGVLGRGMTVDAALMAAIGLAVAAVPEGLPAVMTIALAIGVTRMARRNAIIRRLPAVETLGAVGVIGSDKTGTLTRNELTVQTILTAAGRYAVTGTGYAPVGQVLGADGSPARLESDPALAELARAALLCNDAGLDEAPDGTWTAAGDPTEGALLALAGKLGADATALEEAHPRSDVLPFDSDRKLMATLHAGEEGFVLVKGAPERILDLCGAVEGVRDFDRAAWAAAVERLAGEGQRVIALARRPAPEDSGPLHDRHIDGLVLIGLCGLIDPAREDALAAVRHCRQAGIRVVMITGDHAATARAIAARFGIGDGTVLTGPELDRLDEAGFAEAVGRVDVFARTTPAHKLRIVETLQAGGQVVAMTGDGVNDAPALKRADVGIAMGRRGTEAAKEAAAMVLADDNFASIAHAVEEGRTVHDNLRKTLLFLLPTNGAQALVVMAAVLAGYTAPFTPVQVLWVNMVTAVTLGLALAFERPEPDVMTRPPRPTTEPLIPGALVRRMAVVTLLLLASAFGLFLAYEAAGRTVEAARAMAVNGLVAGEVAFLLSARSVTLSALTAKGLAASLPVWLSIGLIALLQVAFTHAPPMQAVFATAALDWLDWLLVLGVGLLVLLAAEAEKAIARGSGRRAQG